MWVILVDLNKDAYNDRKSLIIEAAKKVVTEQGFHKLNFRAVAQEANMSPGTLYYYCKSKNEILYNILDSTTRELNVLSDKIEQGFVKKEDIAEWFFELTVNHIENVDRNKIFLHLVHESFLKDSKLRERLADKYNSWVESFERLFRLYFNVPAPLCRGLAILYDAMVDGLLIKHLLGLDPINQPGVKHLLKLILHGAMSGFNTENVTGNVKG